MFDRWRRLISCVCMLAFFFANSHAGMVVNAYFRDAGTSASQSCQAAKSSEPVESKPSRCKHCARQQDKAKATEGRDPAPEELASEKVCNETNSPHGTLEESCPCCPSGPSCPCPGGCAMCSVAKSICTDSSFVDMLPAKCFDQFVPDHSIVYLPPSGEGLIRPPRA